MDREDLIDMAVDAGARDFGNPEMWGVLQMSYESLERFAKEVAAQERRKCEDEAITKNIVANWPYDKWAGLTDEEIEPAAEQSDHYAAFHSGVRFAAIKLKEKNT